MIIKILKRIFISIVVVLAISLILLITPRAISALRPGKPPVGYHFIPAAYTALFLRLERLVDVEPAVPEEIEEIKNIEYKNINGQSLQIDMYKPKNISGNPPLLVFIHGGGWKSGLRSDYKIYLIPFAQEGYITATVSYRLLKVAPYPACVEDISDAVRWFYANADKYGYDPDRIALIGGSAGGHLSMLAGYGWKGPSYVPDSTAKYDGEHHIKAVVDIYGPADLTTPYAQSQPLVTGFIAHSYAERPDLYAEASPVSYLDENDPPTLILPGTSHDLVPASQSDTLKARLDRLGVPCVYYRYPLWPHTMDIVQRVNDFSRQKMNEFFEEYLK